MAEVTSGRPRLIFIQFITEFFACYYGGHDRSFVRALWMDGQVGGGLTGKGGFPILRPLQNFGCRPNSLSGFGSKSSK